MYQKGDRFHLSGLAFSPPKEKATCLFLAKEVTEFMIRKLGEQQFGSTKVGREGRSVFNCTGCTGLIKFALKTKEEEEYATMHMRMLAKAEESAGSAKRINSLASLLNSFSLFQIMDETSLSELLPHVRVKHYGVGQDVIVQGDESQNVYMVLTGRVEVLSGERTLAFLGRGDIFGEMSMLTGNPVGATIRVAEPAKILFLSNEQFRLMLVKYPALQMRISKILASRLGETNLLSGQDPHVSFSGSLQEIPIAELCQFLHNNTKSGRVLIQSALGEGVILFSAGDLVQVRYGTAEGVAAFNVLIKENSGSFTFTPGLSLEEAQLPSMGNFMNILMEGLQKMDEERP